MHKLIAEIKKRITMTDGVMLKIETTDTYKFLDLKVGPNYFRVTPQTDDGRLVNVEWVLDKQDRRKLVHLNYVTAAEFIAQEVNHIQATYVDKAWVKAKEPLDRTAADVDAITSADIDRLVKELNDEMDKKTDGQFHESDTDQMVDSSPSTYLNSVKGAWGKGSDRSEGTKTPTKTNVNQQNFKKDSTVNWNQKTPESKPIEWTPEVDSDGLPVRLNENLKNTVLCYHKDIGTFFAPKALYEEHKRSKNTHWGFKDGAVTLLREGQKSEGRFVPVNLRSNSR
jgi:hypothetical protein